MKLSLPFNDCLFATIFSSKDISSLDVNLTLTSNLGTNTGSKRIFFYKLIPWFNMVQCNLIIHSLQGMVTWLFNQKLFQKNKGCQNKLSLKNWNYLAICLNHMNLKENEYLTGKACQAMIHTILVIFDSTSHLIVIHCSSKNI